MMSRYLRFMVPLLLFVLLVALLYRGHPSRVI